MVLIALLLVALVCLALGLVLASAVWLIASLVASVLAALVLWRVRGQLVSPARGANPVPDGSGTGASAAADPNVWVVDGRPRYHLADCAIIKGQDAEAIPYRQAAEDGFVACRSCDPDAGRAVTADEPATGEDASTEAGIADPAGTADSAGVADGAETGADVDEVWVVDGRPRYHLAGCLIIKSRDAEPIPLEQAIADGFMACSMCEPSSAAVH